MHRKVISLAAILVALRMCSAGPIEDGFSNPPDEAKPRTLWHWMNGHVSKDGIRADLEAMKDAGLGGAVVFNMFWGRLAPGPVPFNTKAWDEHINYAADEAERLGLELTLTHGSGMSDAGGPWVSPSNSVFHLTCSETRVGDGETFRGRLPRVTPKAPEEWFNGFFRDIAVLAFPLPPVEAMGPQTFDVRREGLDRIVSAGGEAFTLRGVCFTVKYSGNGPWYRRMYADVAASDDGKTWRNEGKFDVMISDGGKQMHKKRPVFAAFNRPVTGSYIRIRPDFCRGGGAAASFNKFRPETRRGVENLEERFLAVRGPSSGDVPASVNDEGNSGESIDPSDVIDLTKLLKPDGTIEWTAPKGRGDWVVLRIGYRATGKMVSATTPTGRGLEVDKLDPRAVGRHFAAYVGKFADKKAVTGILNDSWENGSQNWTHGLEKNFEKRYGYSILPYRVFRKVNHYVLKRMARFLNRKSQRYYRLKFAKTYYGEMTHYGLYHLAWADVRRAR